MYTPLATPSSHYKLIVKVFDKMIYRVKDAVMHMIPVLQEQKTGYVKHAPALFTAFVPVAAEKQTSISSLSLIP